MAAYQLAIGDIVQLRTRGTLYGQIVRSVSCYRVTVAPAVPGPQELTDAITQFIKPGSWFAGWIAAAAPDLHIDTVYAQRVAPVRQAQAVTAVDITGTGGGTSVPPNTAISFTKYTDTATRRKDKLNIGGIGYLHLPGMGIDQLNGGFWKIGLLLSMKTNIADKLNVQLMTPLGTIMVPTLWHRKAVGLSSTDVINGVVQSTVRTQRRRTVGVGE